ncbi:delta-type opioid receptor-like [Watersipora subatra]|uniref:delta-type opioid receptor-like n=1 Tax=Watersipora subatra TaxID=2589382 RepID=UPI00355C3AAF
MSLLSNVSTENLSAIRLCTGEHSAAYSTAILVFNIVSVLANVLHISILFTTDLPSKRNYFLILINLAVADIVASCDLTTSYSPLLSHLPSPEFEVTSAVLQGVGMAVGLSRYSLLALASFDRYYAVCKAFQYSTSTLSNHIGKILILVWIINLALSGTLSTSPDIACLMNGKVQPNFFNWKGIVSLIVIHVFLFVSLLLTTICLTAVFKEIQRMKKRTLQEKDQILIKTSDYIIGTIVMLYASASPLFLVLICFLLKFSGREPILYVASQIGICLQTLYGVGNIAFYAYLNPEYRLKVKKLCKSICVCKVRPIEE